MQQVDMIFNGQAQGPVANVLMQNNFDVRVLRPYIGKDGRSYITATNAAGELVAMPIQNTNTTLRKDDWKILDDAIVRVAKERLKAVADLRSMGLTYNIPNGMSKTVLETESQSDINPASVSMDGLRENGNDRPEFAITNLPLPIIHKDFHFSARQLAASRNGGSPLDTTTAEAAGRRVAEEAEKMLLGVSTVADQYSYGGGKIYGYTDFPSRLTKTITSPTASGWVPKTLVDEVIAMQQQSRDASHYGPWKLYLAPNWGKYLAQDYVSGYPKTLQQRLEEIPGVTGVEVLDYLTDYDIVFVQMSSEIVREVIGMDMTTVQWESKGGMQLNYKVMAIMVPQLRADFNGNTGIVHGSTS